MALIVVAALMMAEAPAAVQTAPSQQAAAKKAKPAQVCEYMEITGSRARQRVCRDADGNLDLGPGISNSLAGKGKIDGYGTGSTAPTQQ